MTADNKTWYLAGPMTGVPYGNLPSFIAAAGDLRAEGYTIITPVEFASDDVVKRVLLDSELPFAVAAKCTWGEALANDIRMITDEAYGIVFLDGWEKSKGARLEAFVGLTTGRFFARYTYDGKMEMMSRQMVLTKITRAMRVELNNEK